MGRNAWLFPNYRKSLDLHNRIPRWINILITFCSVSFAWIFFRAESISDAISFIIRMFAWNPEVLANGTLFSLGLDKKDWIVIVISVLIAIVIAIIQNKKISIYKLLNNKNIIFRWCIYYLIILALIIFGKYGATYDANNFVYFKF